MTQEVLTDGAADRWIARGFLHPFLTGATFGRPRRGNLLPSASNTFVADGRRSVISSLKTWVATHTVNQVLVSCLVFWECRFVWQ